jgi:hypothetical protein
MSSQYRPEKAPVFGYMATYASSAELLDAIRRVRARGYRKMEAYTPQPDHEILHALEYKNRLPFIVLCGGALGALAGFGMQYWSAVHHYPLNVGGRPLNSWPSFIVITFEMTVLFAALAAVFGMLALNDLPKPYHPAFNVPGFELASRNRFFLLVMSRDELFDMNATRELLEETDSLAVAEVPY